MRWVGHVWWRLPTTPLKQAHFFEIEMIDSEKVLNILSQIIVELLDMNPMQNHYLLMMISIFVQVSGSDLIFGYWMKLGITWLKKWFLCYLCFVFTLIALMFMCYFHSNALMWNYINVRIDLKENVSPRHYKNLLT